MKTEIIAIVDRSGSMSSVRQAAIDGFNNFIADQAEVPGEARVTYVHFNESVQTLYEGKHIASVPKLNVLTYTPNGWTAMRDAIGDTLNRQGARIAREQWADKVIVVILTDGHENRSTRYSIEQVQSMVQHAEAHGWSFVFLGANIDAQAEASSYGIRPDYVYQFAHTVQGTNQVYAQASSTVRSLRGTSL